MADTQRDTIVNQLVGLGWSKDQALGLAANFHQESNFNPAAVGDGGKAYGIGQWHPDRQSAFQEFAGKPIQGSTLQEQVAFADYELRRGNERRAGGLLSAAQSAGEAASIVSRHYERPADRNGEATRRAQKAAAWAGGTWEPDSTVPSVAPARPQEGPYSGQEGAQSWPRLPTPQDDRGGAQKALLAANAGNLAFQTGTPEQSYDAQQRQYDAQAADVEARSKVGFWSAFETSRSDPRDQPMFTILNKVNNVFGDADPSFDYMANRDQIEAPCGADDDCRSFLRENVQSADAVARAHAEIALRQSNDKAYNMAGPWSTFLGRAAGGMMDPVGFAASVAGGKLLHLAGLGAQTAIRAGRPGLAAAAVALEGAAGNVAVEGIQDAMGEVKTSSDYAMAAAAGAVLGGAFGGRGAYRDASHSQIVALANDMKTRATAEQAAKVRDYMTRTGETDPELVARGVEREEAQTIQEAVREGSTPQEVKTAAMPDDVVAAIREADIKEPAREPIVTEPPPKVEGAEPKADTAPFEPEPIDLPVIDSTLLDGKGSAEIRDKQNKPIYLSYENRSLGERPDGVSSFSPRETLDALIASKNDFGESFKQLAKYLRGVLSDDVLDTVHIKFGGPGTRGRAVAATRTIETPSHAPEGSKLQGHIDAITPRHAEVVLHEMIHAATQSKINAYLKSPKAMTPAQRAVMDDFQRLFDSYKAEVDRRFGMRDLTEMETNLQARNKAGEALPSSEMAEYKARYGTKNLHEFATTAMSSAPVRSILRQMDGPPVAGKPSSAWKKFTDMIAELVTGKRSDAAKQDALNNVTATIDRIIGMDGSNIYYSGGDEALNAPALFNGQGQRRFAQALYQHAANYLAQNPIDVKKLAVMTAKLPGGLSDGLVLARSKNPILQMVAGLVTETTTGAAGRNANVAIRTQMLHRKFVGDAMLSYTNNFTTWGKQNGATVWDSVMQGNKRREFDRLVYGEILDRRNPNHTSASADPTVREAADQLEALFERSRKAQVAAGTLGSDNLPGDSRGYITQALDGTKLQTLSTQELDALHQELSHQFQTRLGWDKSFADTFAPYYTDRVRKRAQGSKGVDELSAGGDAMQVVRDTLDDMTVDPQMRDRMTAAGKARAGIGNTKKRLDLDLRREFVPGKPLLDVFVDNPLALGRSYARRTAGNVALTEQGILGVRGVRELMDAAGTPVGGQGKATLEELEAANRVFAEILGTPVAGQVVSAGASNLSLLVGLQRLGGLVFTQAAEQFNMIHHLGLRSALSGVAAIPKMLGEVGRLKKGRAAGNHILDTIEAYGGEIGTDSYKMVAPLDPPEARLEDYMKQSGLITRLLRTGGHMQAKISFFRGLMSAQHRAAAEQIVMKAARFIRDGGDDIALRDMGFTPDVVTSMKADLARVARWDSNGNLTAFDLTRVTDPRTAEAFVQAVHRGTSQIIQGTFIGERSKWMHNDYMRLMLQLRTFGLTATEKQLQRTAMLHGGGFQGYAYAGGIMLGQIALAMPIHAARVEIASVGREDRSDYIKDNLAPAALVRAAMNYSSITGSTGDVLELLTAIAGGWADDDTRELIGARNSQQATSIGKLIPAAGSVDNIFKVASGKADLHTALRQLPFSNLPYVAPAISFTKE